MYPEKDTRITPKGPQRNVDLRASIDKGAGGPPYAIFVRSGIRHSAGGPPYAIFAGWGIRQSLKRRVDTWTEPYANRVAVKCESPARQCREAESVTS
jgi:hypothetical protein